uniref:Uncharacterized protein n=1 Tax=Rhizophora mucronata TaxID=61149 RepID=A0A2P2IQL5_RHIMU
MAKMINAKKTFAN